MEKINAYLGLMRPANIVTAWTNIIAGYSAALFLHNYNSQPLVNTQPAVINLFYLLIATTGLYGGGIVFNDVFDAKLDARERPERAIPKGIILRWQATLFGAVLFAVGLMFAYMVSIITFTVAAVICVLCLTYDSYLKKFTWLGPINMGLCRSSNLLLGASVVSGFLPGLSALAGVHLLFVAAITSISKGEIYGSNQRALYVALGLYMAVLLWALYILTCLQAHLLYALPFLILFAYRVMRPLLVAVKVPIAANIRTAVKAGIISIIILDAAITAGFSHILYGFMVLALLLVSIGLSKQFAVT